MITHKTNVAKIECDNITLKKHDWIYIKDWHKIFSIEKLDEEIQSIKTYKLYETKWKSNQIGLFHTWDHH